MCFMEMSVCQRTALRSPWAPLSSRAARPKALPMMERLLMMPIMPAMAMPPMPISLACVLKISAVLMARMASVP